MKPKYQQPHNIHYDTGNEALDEHLRYKEHHYQKYQARWSKQRYENEKEDKVYYQL